MIKFINIIAHILFSILPIIIIIFLYKHYYKNSKTIFEKLMTSFIAFLLTIILILYSFDRYNLGQLFLITKNIDSQNWLNILSNFCTTLLGELLGGLILIYVTMLQIEENKKEQHIKEQEDRRINNMPLLVYSFLENNIESSKINNIYELETKVKGKKTEFTMSIKNIGMNAVRTCYIKIKEKCLEKTSICELDEQSSLNKNENKAITFFLNLDFGKHDFEIMVYYEDLLHNWYSQKIDFEFELFDERTMINYYTEEKYKVYDETIIEKPVLKTNINKYR